MKFLRRVHLYSGLALVPFVLLYGVTGFLFNHPDAFSDRDSRALTEQELQAFDLAGLPGEQELAQGVLAALNDGQGEGDPDWSIDAASIARSGRFFFSHRNQGVSSSLVLQPESGAGRLSARPLGPQTEALLDGRKLELADDPAGAMTERAAAFFSAGGTADGSLRLRSAPRIEFDLHRGDRSWRARYDLRTGELSGRPLELDAVGRSVRSFALRLHKAHGFGSAEGSRWWWAILVDVMAAAMVAWGLTGVLMWWQIKTLRVVGGAAIGVGVVVALVLATGMWNALA